MTILSLQNILLRIPTRERPILDNVSLDLSSDDFIILLGSNGSGKSSLLKLINGHLLPSEGNVLLHGESIVKKPIYKRAQSIATLSQDLSISTFGHLTVLDNCKIAMHRYNTFAFSLSKSQEKAKVTAYLSSFHPHLQEKLNQRTSCLSGGERQALALAMALCHTPSILLLDEHTSALDPGMAEKILQLTQKKIMEKKIPTIMTTHRLEDALLYGNRIIALDQGRVVLDVSKEEKRALTYEKLRSLYH